MHEVIEIVQDSSALGLGRSCSEVFQIDSFFLASSMFLPRIREMTTWRRGLGFFLLEGAFLVATLIESGLLAAGSTLTW